MLRRVIDLEKELKYIRNRMGEAEERNGHPGERRFGRMYIMTFSRNIHKGE